MTASKREKIRGVLLAALMVASVFAAAAPASAGVASGNRTTASSVAPGGTTTVTVTATMDGSGGSFSLNEEFSGEVDSASVRSVTVDGSSASPIIARANENTAVVTLSSLSANANVEVTYVVNATSSTGDITISGNISGAGPDVDLGTDTISVGSSSSSSAITSASRTTDSTVAPGGSASVTVSAQLNSSGGGFSLNEAFSGDVSGATVQSVTVDGSPASPIISRANSNTAVVTLSGLPGNANIEVNYLVNATSTSSGSISISGTASSSGDFDLGTDTISISTSTGGGASAPAEGSYSAGGYAGDDTSDTNTTDSVTTQVADLDFSSSPGNVDNVTVDPAAGSESSGIDAGDIEDLEVILQTSSGTTSQTASYSGSPVDLNFGNVSDVTGVEVLASTSGSISDGDVIDLGIELGVGSSLFTGVSGLYDTDGAQTTVIGVRDSFISAEVRDTGGNPITNGSVIFRNLDTGRAVADVPLNTRGETRRVNVAPSTYEAEVIAPGFETFSGRVTVDVGETREIDVTLSPINVTDEIRVNPKSATAIADEETITYTVTVLDKNDNPLQNIQVDASDDDPDIFFTSATTNTTDSNGQATFTVASPVIATDELTFTARNESGPRDPTTNATATFIRSGEGAIDGQVFDTSTTSGLPNATVYTVLETRWEENTRPTSIDLDDLSLVDDDDKIFVRLVDEESGEIIDNDEYDVRTRDESGTGVRLVEALNESNDAVGEGFALVDINDDGELDFNHTRLAPEDYYAQVSLDANETSDERVADEDSENFVNVTDVVGDEVTSVGGSFPVEFNPTTDLRVEATRERANLSGSNLVDMTDADGDFKLTQLYTEYQLGRDYVVVAEKAGYSTDIADVFVQEDGSIFEDRVTRGLNLTPEDVEPDAVNITQIGLHPPLSATGGVPNASQIDPFPDKSDDFAQRVPRDGQTVDVVEIETLDEDGNRINGTAEVAVEDDVAFGGSWENAAYGGSVVDYTPSEDQITVNTGNDGVARLLLFADSSSADLLTNKTAVLTNDRSATDNTTVEFVGQLNFRGAAISGIVTDTNDTPVQDSVVWTEEFVLPTPKSQPPGTVDAPEDQVRFTIDPTGTGAEGVDDSTDTFVVSRQDWNTSTSSWEDIVSQTVQRQDLLNYEFSGFTGVTVNTSDGDGFNLVEVNQPNDPDASYTLDPVPAVTSTTGAASTDYEVRAVKLSAPNRSATRFGQAQVQPGSTDDANVALPIDIPSVTNFQVTNLTAPAAAAVGDTITVTADIGNIGVASGTQTVEFRIGGSTVTSQQVNLNSDQNTTVTFNVDTSGLAPGNYTHGVFTDDDSETAQITLGGTANFTVDSISSPVNVTQGDTLNVSALINNTGAGSATKPVSLTINGTNVSTGSGAVDIAFLIDRSGSMSDEISAVRSGLTTFTNTLENQGIDVRYAIVTYGESSPRYNVVQSYTANLTATQTSLNNIQANAFGFEYSFDAINGSINDLNERSGANEIFIVTTDEDSEGDSNPGSASAVANLVDAEDVQLFAATLPAPELGDATLSVGTAANQSADGKFFNIAEGNFSAKFENEISTAVANASAGQQLTLAGKASGTVNFSISGNTTSNLAPGNYTIEVSTPDDTNSTALEIDSSCSNLSPFVAGYDTDGDCSISITELGQAGSDYATGQISITELGQVGSAYART